MSPSYIWTPNLEVPDGTSRYIRVLADLAEIESIVLLIISRRTAKVLLCLVEDPEKATREHAVGPGTAVMAKDVGEVQLTGREENTTEVTPSMF